jgi:hypothetical protein
MQAHEVAREWADILETAADLGAPLFAWDLAELGANPDRIRFMAASWRLFALEPRDFADRLDRFAVDIAFLNVTEGVELG